jgi:hypothetical protein
MSSSYPPSAAYPCVLAERAANTLEELGSPMTRIARALEEGLGVREPWFSGLEQGKLIDLDECEVSRYAKSVARARTAGIPEVCCLRSSGGKDAVEVFVDVEATPSGTGVASASFSVAKYRLSLDQLMPLVIKFATAFEAVHAHFEEERLLLEYQERRAFERTWDMVPPDLRQYIPEPEVASGDLALPDLLVPQEYDRLRVPAGVWWVNYFGRPQVETLGEERIRGAGWARVEDAGSGSLALAPTEEPLDLLNPAHTRKLSNIIDRLALVEAQRAARYAR